MGMTCGLTALDESVRKSLESGALDLLEFEENDVESPHCNIDKAWHGLHFLFTGTAWEGPFPQNFLLAGGHDVGDEDNPGRIYSPPEVATIAAWLETVTPAALTARFDPPRMLALDIYPRIWDRDPAEDDTLGYLLENFADLQAFVRETRQSGRGLLLSVH